MVLIFVCVVVGCIVGAVFGGIAGAAVGFFAGLFIGGVAYSALRARRAVREGASELTIETRRLTCIPKGQVAECQLVCDAATGKWIDVARCSLQTTHDQVTCEKPCLQMLNDSRVRPAAAA